MFTEAENVESAITAIEGILDLPILKQHKYALIDGMIWTITQARGNSPRATRSSAAD